MLAGRRRRRRIGVLGPDPGRGVPLPWFTPVFACFPDWQGPPRAPGRIGRAALLMVAWSWSGSAVGETGRGKRRRGQKRG